MNNKVRTELMKTCINQTNLLFKEIKQLKQPSRSGSKSRVSSSKDSNFLLSVGTWLCFSKPSLYICQYPFLWGNIPFPFEFVHLFCVFQTIIHMWLSEFSMGQAFCTQFHRMNHEHPKQPFSCKLLQCGHWFSLKSHFWNIRKSSPILHHQAPENPRET